MLYLFGVQKRDSKKHTNQMKDKNEKAQESERPTEKNTAATMIEFMSGLVEIGREKQGIRYSQHSQLPGIKQTAAH